MSFHDFTRFIFEFLLKLAHMSLLTASHLGTIVASVQVLLHTPHARTHTPHTLRVLKQTYNYTQTGPRP